MYRDWISSLVCLLSVAILCVQCVPVQNRTSAGSAPCAFPSLVCKEPSTSVRCVEIADICDGIKNCASGQDENNCERKGYVINGKLMSSRSIEEDTIIEDVSQESCAKFCSDEDQYTCIGFQHNLQSNQCRLLDAKFTQRLAKSSLRSFWITFQHAVENTTAQDLPVAGFKPGALDGGERAFDGFEGGFDAIIVEVNWDALPQSERTKREAAHFDSLLARSGAACGKRSIDFEPPRANRLGRVVNGVNAPIGAYPWQAAVKLKDGDSLRQWCGGAIISNRLILTAAHCIDHLRRNEFVIVVGEHDTTSSSPKEQIFEIENFIIHPQYRSTKNGYDIALVKVATVNGQGIVFGDVAQPICMPSSEGAYKPGTWCSVSGWGMQKPKDEDSVSAILKVASVPLLSAETCISKEVYGNQLSSNSFPDGMLCAGYLEGGVDACRGDSGGPLACHINGQFQLLGIVSWGEGCADKNKPGVYTKTLHYLSWIHEWTRKL